MKTKITTSPSAAKTAGVKTKGAKTDVASVSVAVKKLSAIAHVGRLQLIRRLIQAGPGGMGAGELARKAKIGPTTASAQLLVLANAGLVTSERSGRNITYRADYSAMADLLGYLMQDCCCGRSEICSPVKALC